MCLFANAYDVWIMFFALFLCGAFGCFFIGGDNDNWGLVKLAGVFALCAGFTMYKAGSLRDEVRRTIRGEIVQLDLGGTNRNGVYCECHQCVWGKITLDTGDDYYFSRDPNFWRFLKKKFRVGDFVEIHEKNQEGSWSIKKLDLSKYSK